MTLRDYQSTIIYKINEAFAYGYQCPVIVAPCGSGKTVMMSERFAENYNDIQFAIAHRQELVHQICKALAHRGLHHRIIAPQNVINFAVKQQVKTFGRSFYHPNAPLAVAAVDTLIRRTDQLDSLLKRARWWQVDEGHHLQGTNKWGTAVAAMPNAKGLGWTATPIRADRKSLKRGQGGLYDVLIEGPSVAHLIERGYLAPYRIIAPKNNIDLSRVHISKQTGDYNEFEVRDAMHRSPIVGDVVATYTKFGRGAKAVIFGVDVALAKDHTLAFNEAGYRFACIHQGTPADERVNINQAMASGELQGIVNVDVLGEGYDAPEIIYCGLARPTASQSLAIQQMMRSMRPAPGKVAIIADHVGNIYGPRGHGLPDMARAWSLDGVEPEPREIPLRHCLNLSCLNVWEGWTKICPECGWQPEPPTREQRERIEMVEGDLIEVSPEWLEAHRREAARLLNVEKLALPQGKGQGIRDRVRGFQIDRRDALLELIDAMAFWRAIQDEDDATCYKRFYARFGIDVATAQELETKPARELLQRVRADYEH